jgi:hypothetical protein
MKMENESTQPEPAAEVGKSAVERVVMPKHGRKIHDIKLHSKYWMAAETQAKMFEIRKNDRDYRVGDFINLLEWDGEKYTEETLHREITYITNFAQQEHYVVIGLTD